MEEHDPAVIVTEIVEEAIAAVEDTWDTDDYDYLLKRPNYESSMTKNAIGERDDVLTDLYLALQVGFILLLIYLLGVYACGIGWLLLFVVLYTYRERRRRQREVLLTSVRMMVIDEAAVVKAKLGKELPSWVYFPDTERAEWLNKIIAQVWPYIGVYTKDILKNFVEPQVQRNLQQMHSIWSFHFITLELGDYPLRIGGVKVYKEHVGRNEIVMDLEIFYAGDCQFQVSVNRIRAGVKDVQMHGTLRVIMRPLIKDIPLVGGIQIFFLNNPRIDFNLTDIADILDLPGLSDMVRRVVIEQVAALMVLPNKLSIPLTTSIPLSALKRPRPAGVLRIHVVEAKELMRKDVGVLGLGKSDPYAVINVGAQEFKTHVVNNTINPIWDFYCEMIVDNVDAAMLDINLFDKDQANKDDFLGRCSLDVSSLAQKGVWDSWIPLEEADSGSIHMKFWWFQLTTDALDLHNQQSWFTQKMKTAGLASSLLVVYLDSALNLPVHSRKTSKKKLPEFMEGNKACESSSLVRFSMGAQRFETILRKNSASPVFEEGFVFVVQNPDVQDLLIEVEDGSCKKSLGMMTFHINKLLGRDNLRMKRQPFPLRQSGPNSQLIMSFELKVLKMKESDAGDGPSSSSIFQDGSTSARRSGKTNTPTSAETSSARVPVPSVDSAVGGMVAPMLQSLHMESVREPSDDGQEGMRRRQGTPGMADCGLGKIQLTIRYNQQRARLVLVIHRIANLQMGDNHEPPNAYCKCYLQPDKSKDSKQKTQVAKRNCNPVFDETFEFSVSQNELNSCQILVAVCNKNDTNLFGRAAVIGQVFVEVHLLDLSKTLPEWYYLQSEKSLNCNGSGDKKSM